MINNVKVAEMIKKIAEDNNTKPEISGLGNKIRVTYIEAETIKEVFVYFTEMETGNSQITREIYTKDKQGEWKLYDRDILIVFYNPNFGLQALLGISLLSKIYKEVDNLIIGTSNLLIHYSPTEFGLNLEFSDVSKEYKCFVELIGAVQLTTINIDQVGVNKRQEIKFEEPDEVIEFIKEDKEDLKIIW